MPSKKVRICIVGNGLFAKKVHYPSLASFDDVEIAGICAFNEERLQETALRFNIPEENIYVIRAGNDYRKMLEKVRPDGVYVIGQPGQMFDIWIWCLEQNYPLYIEKPPGITLHQARSLAWLAEKNNCISQVSFQRRSSPILQQMRQECLKRGDITHALVEFSKYDPQPMLGERDRMLDDYTHAVDTARYICGGEVAEVQSRCRRIGVPDINWISSNLVFDNGSSCVVTGSWTSGRRVFRVSMHAPGICSDVEPEKEAWLYEAGDYEGKRFDSKLAAGSDELFVYGGFRQKSREFIDSLHTGRELTSSPLRDALKTMTVCETILAQALLRGEQ